jgi:type I restriction enzyme S subunit
MKPKNNNLPKGWRKVKLGEIGKIITGKTPPTADPENFGGQYPFITIPDIKDQKYIEKTERTISEKGAKIMKNLKIPPKAVVVSCLATVGEIGITVKESFTNQQINSVICDENKIIPEFLYYSLKYAKPRLLKYSGSVYTNISKSKFADFEIEIPEDINEQKRIAEILSAFDEKIELNNKIIKTLEEMAQEVFKKWFNEKSKVKSQRSKLAGWEIKDAEEVFVFEKGIEPGSKYYSETKKEGYIPFYRVRDLDKQSGVDVYIPEKIVNGKICKENDVLLSLDATVGRVKIGCNGAFSSGIRKVYSRDGFIKNSFIYFWLKTPYVQNTILEYASGTTILHASHSIKYLKFPFNKEVIEKIQSKVEPMFEKILQILRENQKLAELRDLLLPKLMSGEIRV